MRQHGCHAHEDLFRPGAGDPIPAGYGDGSVPLQILIDCTSLDVLADAGRTSMSFSLPPNRRDEAAADLREEA
ncbi:MAG: hypothetical protein JXA90_16380 [Planctomycetes bacterium]|nr:hypothetical protein [Planctomycetota bacterium]